MCLHVGRLRCAGLDRKVVMSSVERSGKGMGIGIGGALVISGVIIAVIWSVVIGIIVAVIGLVAFGGFVRGKWY